MTDTQAVLLYRSGRDLTLRIAEIFTLLPVAITLFLLSLMTEEQIIKDLGSIEAGWAFKAGLALFSGILFYAMLWISGRYVLTVERLGENVRIRFWTVLLPRTCTWPVSAWQGGSEFHDGKLVLPGRPIVNAPWTGLHTPEGRKLILDDQGEYPHGEDALLTLLAPADK